MKSKNFASDNNAGISPQAMRGLIEANEGHVPAYGEDHQTTQAKKIIQEWLETRADVYFVTGGTAANCLSIASSIRSYQSVVCHPFAHIENDECHAPSFFKAGVQLRFADGPNGKIKLGSLDGIIESSHGVHGTLPGLISITQCTEVGTCYTPNEIKALSDEAHQKGMHVHMDGARFSNACISLAASPAELSWRSGVDLLSLGGVKNGLGFGEVLVVFNKEVSDRLDYRVKQSGQLMSKMRFLSAPWIGYLESGEWKINAQNANEMAMIFSEKMDRFDFIKILYPVETNAIFCEMPEGLPEYLEKQGWNFYPFNKVGGWRLMTSWDSQIDEIEAFVQDVECWARKMS